VLARSFLSRPLSRWMLGVPLTQKTTLPKLSGKGLIWASGLIGFRVQAPGFRVKD
jgi:hypothetical protein